MAKFQVVVTIEVDALNQVIELTQSTHGVEGSKEALLCGIAYLWKYLSEDSHKCNFFSALVNSLGLSRASFGLETAPTEGANLSRFKHVLDELTQGMQIGSTNMPSSDECLDYERDPGKRALNKLGPNTCQTCKWRIKSGKDCLIHPRSFDKVEEEETSEEE